MYASYKAMTCLDTKKGQLQTRSKFKLFEPDSAELGFILSSALARLSVAAK